MHFWQYGGGLLRNAGMTGVLTAMRLLWGLLKGVRSQFQTHPRCRACAMQGGGCSVAARSVRFRDLLLQSCFSIPTIPHLDFWLHAESSCGL